MLKIGTRGSALALAQAQTVADAIQAKTELVTIETAGDRGADEQDKSRFVKEIDRALQAGDIDLAVHSAKDVPAELADGLVIAGCPPPESAHDVLVGVTALDELSEGARVGTSSLRRRSQLLAARPDLTITELRGNVDTRLEKLADGDYDAIVLAEAGLNRLHRQDETSYVLPLENFVPAAGQGVLAVQCRDNDGNALAHGTKVSDQATVLRLVAERAAVAKLGADCHSSVGIYATASRLEIELIGYVGTADGKNWLTDRVTCSPLHPKDAGRELASRLLSAGAGELLKHTP